MESIKGSCHCKKITFELNGPIISAYNCHCKQCQQLHGSAFVTRIGFKHKNIKINDKENNFKTFDSETAQRGFCLNCWSTFYFKYTEKCIYEDQKEDVHIAYSNIETKINFKPTEHIYYNSHVSWFESLNNLPKRK